MMQHQVPVVYKYLCVGIDKIHGRENNLLELFRYVVLGPAIHDKW